MRDQPSQHLKGGDGRLARAIILQLLRDDHVCQWSRAELETELADIPPLDISDALARLETDGIVNVAGELIWASRALARLDGLDLIAV